MTDSFNELDSKMDSVIENTTKVNNDILAMKMLIKMIMGLATNRADEGQNFSEEQYVNSLPEDAKAIYEEMKNDVISSAGIDSFDFTTHNLVYIVSQ